MSRIRIREPQRKKGEIRLEVPENVLPREHPALLLCQVVETLDISRFERRRQRT